MPQVEQYHADSAAAVQAAMRGRQTKGQVQADRAAYYEASVGQIQARVRGKGDRDTMSKDLDQHHGP